MAHAELLYAAPTDAPAVRAPAGPVPTRVVAATVAGNALEFYDLMPESRDHELED